ncbi:autotransporter outer membrane beta-barrel domain-containing protein [Megasphaera sp. SW808]|uniref:autotransporter outer membrane beta-barrel domain-containing protein n=1 Tax=Megasphaera sp. SW808 TaxID=2530045 RepID=UPI00143C4C2F|nr:autotransporter outer membrane beta-barrel domain-containing protein [Megasphaera sp. SW808]NJE34026.1 autotransporter outer membrane beta-barrel domain-containing protein [Megasphaera sp. SW808]
MKKEVKYKVLLCLLAGSVLSANTALAAEYKVPFFGSNDDLGVYDDIKTNEGREYIYDVGENAVLKVSANGTTGDYSKNAYGIIIVSGTNPDWTNAANTDKIAVLDSLNINVTGNGGNSAAGIAIQGSDVSNKTIDRSKGGDIIVREIDTVSDGNAYGVAVKGSNNKILIGNSKLDISATGESSYVSGLAVEGNNNEIVMGNGYIKATANTFADENTNYAEVYSTGIKSWDTSRVVAGDVDIEISAIGNEFTSVTLVNGVDAGFGESTVTIGNGNVIATAVNTGNGASYANAIYAADGATVTKGNGNVIAKAEGAGNIEARGIFANNGTVNVGVADIKAETTGGDSDSKSIGLLGQNDGEINFAGGSITAVADDEDAYVAAISAEDDSVINVNQGTNNRIVINGNVDNFGSGAINLNLNTVDSVLTGSIEDENGTLNLENDASWSATGYSEVNKLTMNQGNIYVDTPSNIGDITINKYSGVGNVIFKADNTDEDGIVNINTSSFIISNAIENSFINVGVSNASINTLDFNKAKENLNTLAGKVYYDGDKNNLNGKVIIKEGLITPEVSGDLLFDTTNNNRGYVTNITGGNRVTKTMDAMKHIAETAIVAWRQEDSTLSQRLGDLRESDGGQGIWVRMSRGEFNYDSQYENQYNFFQLGYDWARGNWHYGAAVSHNDGETTYAQGMGENRSTSLSLYGTWLGRNGHYADIVLKQGRLSNDFDIYTEAGHTHGDYDMWGTSLSGEYGRKIDLKDGWYVTPQAQMTLMRIGGEDFTTNNGIHVRQDSLESAVGRVGFEVGKAFDKKGSIYAKASLLHDFAGSADTYLSLKGLSNSYSQDIGDTWWEAGLGFNYKVNDSSYLYADVVKTFGGDVETPWQWNVGMRWAFV